MSARGSLSRVALLLALLSVPYAAASELPVSFRAARAQLKVRLICPSEWIREYDVTRGTLVFRDSAWKESGGAREIRVEMTPEQVGTILEKVLTSTFPDLPARVGDRIYVADGDTVEIFRTVVSTGCQAELLFLVDTYSKSVSYGDLSLLPVGVLEELQQVSGERGADGS